jgi:hypothetical protein
MKLAKWQTEGKSQKTILFRHMERIGAITKLQALNFYGIMNSGARILEIREMLRAQKSKLEVKTIMFVVPSGKRVAKYMLGKIHGYRQKVR